MTRRAAVICLALVALALVASSAQAASSPATSKGKKGKGVCSIIDTCAIHTDAEHTAFSVALGAQLESKQDEFKAFTREVIGNAISRYTVANPVAGCTTDIAIVDNPVTQTCRVTPTADPPARVVTNTVCPPGNDGRIGAVIELLCFGFLTDANGFFIRNLPNFRSGVSQGKATCEVEVGTATPGQVVVINNFVKCSRFREGTSAMLEMPKLADLGITPAP
jgi:hypothetical protein